MGLIRDFENWTKGGYTFGDASDDLKGFFKLKMPVGEAALKAGQQTRSQLLIIPTKMGEGLLGTSKGSSGKTGGKMGSWDDYNPFKWFDDQKKDAVREYQKRMDDLYNVIPEVPSGEDASGFIKDVMPTVDLSGVGEGIQGGMSDFAMALGMGLGSLGQGIGGGIGGLGDAVPSMPSMSLVDDEGAPNVVVIGGLALVAYMVLKGRK